MNEPISRRIFLRTTGAAGALALLNGRLYAAAGVLERIQKERVLRIGIDAGFPPFSFRDKTGRIVGYDHDLAATLLKPIGVEPKLIDTQWSGIIPSLYTGHFDAIMGGISYTKARAEKVAFSIPYAEASQALLIRATDKGKVRSVEDMSGRTIGIKLASPAEGLIEGLGSKLEKARGKGFSSVKTYDDLSTAYLALAQGSIDAVMNSIATMSVVMRDKPGAFHIVKGVGVESWCAIAVRKEDTDLLGFLNRELTRVRKTGEIYELQKKWFQFTMPLPDELPTINV